jgi:hypothetical protein
VTFVTTALAILFAVTTGRRGARHRSRDRVVGRVLAVDGVLSGGGKAGLLPPALAAWATNILFMAVACIWC